MCSFIESRSLGEISGSLCDVYLQIKELRELEATEAGIARTL